MNRRDLSKLLLTGGVAAFGSSNAQGSRYAPTSPNTGQSAPNQANTTNATTQDMDPWATRVVTSTEESDTLEGWEQTLTAGFRYDLLIKGGTVIDPEQGLHGLLDVAVKNGKISQVARDIPPGPADRVVSAKDKIVTPGFIDLHLHCSEGNTFNLNNIDGYCMGRGTTTVVDAGSTGYLGINRFIKDIVDHYITRIFAMVHICPLGDTTTLEHLMDDMKNVSPQWTAMAAEANKPTVLAIKVHLSTVYFSNPKDMELEALKRALEAAELCHLPLMAHIDQTYYPMPISLNMLRKGDIRTHCFSQWPIDTPLDANGKILPEVRAARDRGVFFDVADAFRHLSFDVAEKCIRQGFLPDTISTDMNRMFATERVYDLPTMVSKFLALGMNLDQAIACVTVNPTKVFDFGIQIGTLRPGSEADIGIFEIQDGNFEFRDINGLRRIGHQKIVNKAVVCRGNFYVNQV